MAIPLTGIIFITAGFCGIIAIISHYIKKLHLYWAAANFTGPPALPIIGNAHLFWGSTTDILNKMNALTEKYPSSFRLWLGSKLMIVLYDADHVKTILLSNNAIEKDGLYKFMQPFIGTGLVSAPAAKSKIHRKLIIPTFSQKILDSFVDIFNEQSLILMKQMRNELGKGEFDIFDYVSLCTLDIICETAMGVSVNAQARNDTTYIDAVKRGTEIIYLRMFRIWLHPDFIFNISKLGKDQRKCLKIWHGITDDVIRKKQDALEKASQIENKTAIPEKDETKKVFLDHLMALSNDGPKLTDVELRDEVETMIIAGNDTSATVSSFTIMMLASFPEIQEKVYQELCEIYGDEISSDTPIDKDDLNHMDYLDRVIKETMRLFPPAQMIARTLTGDITIGEKTLPKGSTIALIALKLHRWEKYWPDPLKFDPDRFLPEEVAKRHPYCYIPFSGGPRGCIGQKYAIMTLKILLATVVRRYVFIKDKPMKVQDIKLKSDVLLKPAEPLTVRIVERSVGPKHHLTISK